mgnify:FL=1|jgi:hypothetical protein
MKIGMLLPSNHPSYYKDFEKSLNNLGKYRDIFEILLVAQSPWSTSDFDDAKTKHKVLLGAIDNPSMTGLRGRAYDLMPDCDYYMLVDDDLQFGPDYERYFETVLALLEDNYAAICTYGERKHDHGLKLNPDYFFVTTSRGLFVKNHPNIFSSEKRNLKGGVEEPVIAYSALINNPRYATIGRAPVTRRDAKSPSDEHSSFIHDTRVLEDNAYRYIRETYFEESWSLFDGRLPAILSSANEASGGSCNYYRKYVDFTFDGRPSYVAECGEIIDALEMNQYEGNAFKEIWRMAAARQGRRKAGNTTTRGGEKIKWCGQMIIERALKNGN